MSPSRLRANTVLPAPMNVIFAIPGCYESSGERVHVEAQVRERPWRGGLVRTLPEQRARVGDAAQPLGVLVVGQVGSGLPELHQVTRRLVVGLQDRKRGRGRVDVVLAERLGG